MDKPISRVSRRREFLATVGATATAAAVLHTSGTASSVLAAEEQEPAVAMRTPDFPAPRPTRAPDMPTPPPLQNRVLNKMGFGPRPGDVQAFNALGTNNTERLQNYIDEQLNPGSIDDSQLDGILATSGFTTLNKTLTQLWADHEGASSGSTRELPYRELERVVFLRAVYSRRQLQEVLADFWHNHFNVYADSYPSESVWVHYDRDVIRGHMLGNFRQMLEAVATSPAMLYYLDNYTNSNGGPNENYARELFELHTLGAENYHGVVAQHQVPPYPGNSLWPIGYVDQDVYEATRALTGWTTANGSHPGDPDNGAFWYRGDWHDRFQKSVLNFGVSNIPPDQPDLWDGRRVLTLLAQHPGTGRHIARKLCQRLISDNPPQSLIDQAGQFFTANWQSPTQLRDVVDLILNSPEFANTWGEKIKRPFEVVVSFLRGLGIPFPLVADAFDDSFSDDFMWYFSRTGQDPFQWRGPDGYPDTKEAWMSTRALVQTWRMLNRICDFDSGGVFALNILGHTPAARKSANQLASLWIGRVFGRAMDEEFTQEIVQFMAQGRDPDVDLQLQAHGSVQNRLRTMVALLGITPDFYWR